MEVETKRHTLVHNRYWVCCESCGFIDTYMHKLAAEHRAKEEVKWHTGAQCQVFVEDHLAHKDVQRLRFFS